MRRRSKAGGEPTKPRRLKTAARKGRIAGKAVPSQSSSAAREETTVQRLIRERDEALEQQAATAEVLKVISRSTFDLQTVLDTLLKSAARLCDARRGVMFRRDGHSYRPVAFYNASPEMIDFVKRHPIKPGRHTITARVALERRTIHVADLQADPEYAYVRRDIDPIRTELGVPMFRENDLVGVIILYKLVVQPFTDKQIELVTTFADQAVIAIENTRLFEAEQRRTRELAESLEQQTATSEVLQVISSSPGELQPVFGTMLENAIRLCQAKFGSMFLYDGEAFHAAAVHGVSPAYAEARRGALIVRDLHPNAPVARVAHTKEVIHVADATLEPSYVERDPRMVEFVDLAGARSYFIVPMLKESRLIGAIGVYRQEVRPFTDKQIELVKNFAAQAVVAIENTRLLSELRQRTDDLSQRTVDLTELLEQQTATSEVLQVISSSPGVLEPVFNTILENATRICEAGFGTLLLYDGKAFRNVAYHKVPSAFIEQDRGIPIVPPADSILGRVNETKKPVHIADLTSHPAYKRGFAPLVTLVDVGQARTVVAVPMLKERAIVGVITIYRQEARPFTDKQIALVTNFASQAVIAIENTRLLNELRESLQQQTATADVLKVISSSPGELEPVFQAMLENATRLCEAPFGGLFLRDAGAHSSRCQSRSAVRPGGDISAGLAVGRGRQCNPPASPHD